ncbi:peptidoglycan-binding domain-containing protein [Nocardia sp. NPDC051463]|uniref:peptidoglycan-binding domain-containing protein n=1 Tax=Nocardia sp. NPDC051463 TaxID=3154845 RepID=UPI00342FA7E7
MGLRSNRFSGDPVLELCSTGSHRMMEPEENLSVMRVQEALRRLGKDSGILDGIFGAQTGAAVTEFKHEQHLSPEDPVVGQGTSGKLDESMFNDPVVRGDADVGELAGFVAEHRVEPFVGLELAPLVRAPFNSQQHDLGFSMLDNLTSGNCLAIVAASRARGVNDPRIPTDSIDILAGLPERASGVTVSFADSDGRQRSAISLSDRLIRGRKFLTHHPDGRRAKASFRGQLCHELTHMRNEGANVEFTPTFDTDTFLDPHLAASLSGNPATRTALVLMHFVNEMNARHVTWIIEQEDAGDPFTAKFLPPAELCEAAFFYFAETDPELFFDNGYIAKIVQSGHEPTYQQIGLWLRRAAELTCSSKPEQQEISAQLFLDAADAAEFVAANPNEPRPYGRGLFPGPGDFH